jgi:cytochrome c oxidase cbb3-type subunit 3
MSHSDENQSREKQYDKLLDHEYDGIREQDNPLPGWWLATFYITIAFSAAYYLYYELGSGPSLVQELAQEQYADELAARAKPVAAGPSDEDLVAASKDSALLAVGKDQFATKCASCHGDAGGGGIGPNLTDEYWIHGGSAGQVYATIQKGVLDKGMPAWGALMTADELKAVVGFVVSLKGTNPPGAKAPQGDKI